jgi:hypothetical protein
LNWIGVSSITTHPCLGAVRLIPGRKLDDWNTFACGGADVVVVEDGAALDPVDEPDPQAETIVTRPRHASTRNRVAGA